MLQRIIYWFRKKSDCKCCCIGCAYYEECRQEHEHVR